MIYKLVLGDWSKDGHGKTEDFLFDCNYDVKLIRQAYKDSCKKLGVTFNQTEDYTGLNLKNNSRKMIWTKYRDDFICKESFDILNKADCFKNVKYTIEDEIYCVVDNLENCAKLIMNFISLSMPKDFAYQLLKNDNYEPINGYWNSDLNVQFGYGLFSC